MTQAYRLFFKDSGLPFKGATIVRGDDYTLALIAIDANHYSDGEPKAITLRLIGKLNAQGAPLIIKENSDFTSSLQGSVLRAEFHLSGAETSIFEETTTIVYDLERTIDGRVSTLDRGTCTITPDIAR